MFTEGLSLNKKISADLCNQAKANELALINEMHPALSKLVNAAENEIKSIATSMEKQSIGVRL